MQLIYHPKVADDLAEAAGFLEERRGGIGGAFVVEAEKTVHALLDNPLRFRVLRDGTRRALLDRFSYAVYFDIPERETVRILVITHCARKPGHWADRLGV